MKKTIVSLSTVAAFAVTAPCSLAAGPNTVGSGSVGTSTAVGSGAVGASANANANASASSNASSADRTSAQARAQEDVSVEGSSRAIRSRAAKAGDARRGRTLGNSLGTGSTTEAATQGK